MKTTKETIKVGVVGCGYWGPNLIRNLRQSPDCQLKLICDASEQRLTHMRRLHPEVATTRRFEDLLEWRGPRRGGHRDAGAIPLRDGQGLL